MIDSATLTLWATDASLIGLSYWIGRVHVGFQVGEAYRRQLAEMLTEVKNVRRKVDRLNDLYEIALRELAEAKAQNAAQAKGR